MSDKPQHSPGPWRSDRVLGADNQPLYEITVDGDGVVAYVEAHDDTDRRNAALIAAAPDMLAMLKSLEWNDGGWCPICYRKYEHGGGHAPDCKLAALLRELP
jgi:hypothetical protein